MRLRNTIIRQRQSNIELLRILLILGIILLHYNNVGIGKAFYYVDYNSFNYVLLHIFESVAIVGVDLFVLVSGYFLCRDEQRDYMKPLQLILQVIIFSVAIYLCKIGVGKAVFNLKSLVGCLIPKNYFVSLYSALYLISPYINVVLRQLSEKEFKRLLVLMLLLFSVWPTMMDIVNLFVKQPLLGTSTIGLWGSQDGYTIVNFCLMYVLGAYMSCRGGQINRKYTWSGMFVVIVLLNVWSYFDMGTAWEYCNPLVIIESCLIFVLFKDMNIPFSRILNRISKGCFTVFLTHATFFRYLHIEEYINQSTFVMLGHLFGSCILLFVIGYLIFEAYDFVMRKVFRLLQLRSVPIKYFDKESL